MRRGSDVARLVPWLVRESGLRWWEIAAFMLASLGSSVVEAGIIALVAGMAASLATGGAGVDLTLGPVGTLNLSAATGTTLGVALLVALIVAMVLAAHLAARMSTASISWARLGLLEAYIRADWTGQAAEDVGTIHEVASTHAVRVSRTVQFLTRAAAAGIGFLTLAAASLLVAPAIALSMLAVTAALVLLLRPLVRATRRYAGQHLDEHNRLVGIVHEVTALAKEVRVFGVSDAMVGRVSTAVERSAPPHHRAHFLMELVPNLMAAITLGVLLVGVVVLSGVGTQRFAELGVVVLFLLRGLRYAQTAQSGVQQAVQQVPYLEQLAATLDRLGSRRVATPAPARARPFESFELRRVSYTYPSGETALRDASLTLHRGDVVGVVGPSGAGKSTLGQLLLELRAPTEGACFVDGHALDDERGLPTRRMGYVSQDSVLFSGDVASNVRFLRDGLGDDQVADALARAAMDRDLTTWPEGPGRQVGAMGHELSGGQRQRVALARALIDSPDLLVLDEPTSALDVTSEAVVRETIAQLAGRALVVVIAHRPTTLLMCTRLLVVRDGRVEEQPPPTTDAEAAALLERLTSDEGQAR